MSFRMLVLLNGEADAAAFRLAAAAHDAELMVVADVVAAFGAVRSWRPAVLVLFLGAEEEEAVLLCRALRKRLQASCPVLALVSRGGSLVESEAEAIEAGADVWLPDLGPDEVVQRLLDILEVPVVAELAQGGEGFALQRKEARAWGAVGVAEQVTRFHAWLQQARRGDYFSVLGIGQDATLVVVAEAFAQHLSFLHGVGEVLGMERDLVFEGLHLVEEAYMVLGNPRLRGAYGAALQREL